MARIRSIHPCVCMSEDADTLSDGAERTMMRLLTHSDDEGRGQDRPDAIASVLYPGLPEKDGPTIDGQMDELAKVGILTRYTVRGKRYYAFTNWAEYQSPQKPKKSKLPPPTDADDTPTPPIERPPDTDTVLVNQERHTPTVDEDLHVSWGREGSGEEGIGGDPPGGDAAASEPQLVDKVASWLATQHGVEFGDSPNLHGMYDAVLRQAMPLLEGKKRHDTAMGLVCDYATAVNGEKVPSGHRARIGRLLKGHLPEHVLYGVAQSMDWGAGLTGEHAKDPDAWLNYVTAVVVKREAGA